MFEELLQKPNQKYFIEAIDTYFALSLERKKRPSDPQLLFQFDQNDFLEGSNEQLNVKFCENLIEEDLSCSTEVTSDEFESICDKDKDKQPQVKIRDFIVISQDSIKQFKDKYVADIQYQLQAMQKWSLMCYNSQFQSICHKPHYTPVFSPFKAGGEHIDHSIKEAQSSSWGKRIKKGGDI